MPPMYSALKKDGKRLYELARKGETVEREPRPIRIDEITLLEAAGARLVFRVRCSKGTYVRSLVEDLAKAAGTVAHTSRLHREALGPFDSEATMDLAEVEQLAECDELEDRLLPPDIALAAMPGVEIDAEAAEKFRGGQAVKAAAEAHEGLARVYAGERDFLGVGELTGDGWLAPRRVFNLPEKAL